MIEQQAHEGDIIEDDFDRPVSIYNMNICLKEDLDLRIQDNQLNEPDLQDLEEKMNNLYQKQCTFKTHLTKNKKKEQLDKQLKLMAILTNDYQQAFQKPQQPIQQSSIMSNCELSSCLSKGDTIPKINLVCQMKESKSQQPTVDLRRQIKMRTQKPFDTTKLKDELSPAVNRFASKKRSQFSQVSHDSSNSYADISQTHTAQQQSQKSIQYIEKRKERSKQVKTTIKLSKNKPHQNLLTSKQATTSRNSSQLSLLHLEQDISRGRSQSSVSTPKSILKNPSQLTSQLDIVSRLSFQSKLSFSSLNIGSQSPPKINLQISQTKKVKFCLTKQQARREHIPC